MANLKTPPKDDHRKKKRTRQPPRTFANLADEHILSERELLERIPLERHTLARMVGEGRFPPPIWLTSSKKGWKWSAVLAWLNQRESDPIRPRPYFGRDKPAETPTA